MQAIAINIGANTNEPGFRGPVWADGAFEYIPIPESKPTTQTVPTYGELAPHLQTEIPPDLHETPVHLDPEFPEYPFCERYTYGDEHGVKAGPLSTLQPGDYLCFYATLAVQEAADGLPPRWGVFLIGHFEVAAEPLEGPPTAVDADGSVFANNAHCKRDPNDAAVLIQGHPASSRLYETALPLSEPSGGTDPNWLVTELSADSGRGPWWRRPLRFDESETEQLLAIIRDEKEPIAAVADDYHR